MYTLIIKDFNGAQTAFNDGLGGVDSNSLISTNGISFYPASITRLELKSDILDSSFISSVSSTQVNECNRLSFVTYDTTGVPVMDNLKYRISAPLLESADYVNSYNNYWNYSQLEYFIDSLPDWYGDWNSHGFSVYINNYLQSTEKLAALIQKANDKGWTIYENY